MKYPVIATAIRIVVYAISNRVVTNISFETNIEYYIMFAQRSVSRVI